MTGPLILSETPSPPDSGLQAATWANIQDLYNALDAEANNSYATYEQRLPAGMIMMWAGSSVAVPDKWLLCDGTPFLDVDYPELAATLGSAFGTVAVPNGYPIGTKLLPDMRDRFVVGAGSAYAVNEKGGEAAHALTTAELAAHPHGIAHDHVIDPPSTESGNQDTSHQHTIAHTHSFTGSYDQTVPSGGSNSRMREVGATTVGNPSNASSGNQSASHHHFTNIPAFDSGGASPAVSASAGSGTAHENRPPYIGILYIIRAES